VSRLARISLSPDEETRLGSQLAQVLKYIEQLKEVNVSDVEPTAHAIPMNNVTRSDQVEPSLSTQEALRNAPSAAADLFVVPKIVE
jgi:aspartyl-tRNA(Asn)/glutamyl-tRNA(Gln) amidotransferase subunit C